MRTIALGLLCAGLAAGTLACTTVVRVRLRGGENLNPNDKKVPTPVRAKVYQLRDSSSFERATFDALWLDEAKELGQDLLDKPIAKDILAKKAGEKYEDTVLLFEEEKGLKKETQFIGVAVAFSPPNPNPDMQGKWKKVIPVDKVNDTVFFMDHYELFLKEN